MIYAKPSTSLLVVFRAYLASDHVTPATGKTIAITISKNGGAFGNPNAGATNATEISSGFYKVTLDTTDTGTAGPLAVRGAAATVDDVGVLYYVGQSPADVTHLLGTAWLTPGTAGTPDVNMKLISDDATAANNLETMLDGTGGQTLSLGQLAIAYNAGGGAGTAAVLISTTNGTVASGVSIAGLGTGAGILVNGGATGIGFDVRGGATSGDGVKVSTTSGHGVNLAPVGTDKHGLFATGGNGGTSDGIKAVAGTGGVPIRGDITGNVTGNLSGSVGSVTGAVGSVTGAVGSVTGNVGGNVTGSVGSVVGAVGSVTGNVGGNVAGSVGSVTGLTASNLDTTVSSRASAANMTTLLAQIGAITGSGVNTVLGFFKALLSKTATLPSDIGGTFDPSTDSTEAIRDRGDAAWTGGGSATIPQIIGGVTKSGSTYYVTYALLIDGAIVTTGLGTLSVTFYDEDGTDLTFSGTPTAGATGLIYASGTLGTAITDNRPVMVKVAVTKDTVARSTFLPSVSIA